jgi:hypothetical protein
MRPLNLLQYSKKYWYCPDTETIYEKTHTPYTFNRRERVIDLRDGSNIEMQLKDHIIGMNNKQMPVHGSTVNSYQPNYSNGNQQRRRHKRRHGRKTVPSNPQPSTTQYIPLTVDEYHQRFCVQRPELHMWIYVGYERYTPTVSVVKSQQELDRLCTDRLRCRMGRAKFVSKSKERDRERRRPRARRV